MIMSSNFGYIDIIFTVMIAGFIILVENVAERLVMRTKDIRITEKNLKS